MRNQLPLMVSGLAPFLTTGPRLKNTYAFMPYIGKKHLYPSQPFVSRLHNAVLKPVASNTNLPNYVGSLKNCLREVIVSPNNNPLSSQVWFVKFSPGMTNTISNYWKDVQTLLRDSALVRWRQ